MVLRSKPPRRVERSGLHSWHYHFGNPRHSRRQWVCLVFWENPTFWNSRCAAGNSQLPEDAHPQIRRVFGRRQSRRPCWGTRRFLHCLRYFPFLLLLTTVTVPSSLRFFVLASTFLKESFFFLSWRMSKQQWKSWSLMNQLKSRTPIGYERVMAFPSRKIITGLSSGEPTKAWPNWIQCSCWALKGDYSVNLVTSMEPKHIRRRPDQPRNHQWTLEGVYLVSLMASQCTWSVSVEVAKWRTATTNLTWPEILCRFRSRNQTISS